MKNVGVDRTLVTVLIGRKLTWSEIIKDSKLSKGAVSSHLNKLIQKKIVTFETARHKTIYTVSESFRFLTENYGM